MKLGLARTFVVLALALAWQAALANPFHVTAVSGWDHRGFGASPGDLTVIGDTVYFAGSELMSQRSLWKSDGTAAGTVRVRAFHSGVDGSQPSQSPNQLTNAGGMLFFFTGSRGVWKSDGTEAGTVLVKDVELPTDSWEPPPRPTAGLSNGLFFFVGREAASGDELWKSDGTAAGTALVKDITPGATGGGFLYMQPVGSFVFFTLGNTLWRSDGTEAGTIPLRTYLETPLLQNAAVGGVLYFAAHDGTSGRELWKSDGTVAGTVMVRDVNAGAGESFPASMTVMGGVLYFAASDGINPRGLWRSDGTAAGTTLVTASPALQNFVYMTQLNGALYFGAAGALWRSDGTAAGTIAVHALDQSQPIAIAATGDAIYVSTFAGHLWKSDGTPAGTAQLELPTAWGTGLFYPVALGSRLVFAYNSVAWGEELWTSDGTQAGTRMVKDILPGAASGAPFQYYIHSWHAGQLLFSAQRLPGVGTELWRSDGTVLGTSLVRDIAPGAANGLPEPGGARMKTARLGNTMLFQAGTGGIWRSDGTTAGTYQLADLQVPFGEASFAVIGSVAYFPASGAGGRGLWKTDGTVGGTTHVAEIAPLPFFPRPNGLTAVGNTLFFFATDTQHGNELWKSDGTLAGTVMVKDIAPGTSGISAQFTAAVGNTLFFTASDGVHGVELWTSDGTAAGTVLVKDINPGSGNAVESTIIPGLVAGGSGVYFVADDGVNGAELWKSDGTEAGTVMVKDIWPGATGSRPAVLTMMGSTLFFVASDPVNGSELWKSDGTAAGTELVKDIAPGTAWGLVPFPTTLTVGDSVLYFAANDGVSGSEVWRSDGTPAGTYRLADVFPGAGHGYPSEITFAGDRLYFVANDGVRPRSLYYYHLGAPEPARLGNISTRAQVLTGDNVLIGGFIVGGTSSKTVVVRARGPSLAAAGITNPLANPQLQVFRSSGQQTIAFNNDWQEAANAAALTASGFAPSDPLESAVLVTLPPGAYTTVMTGVGGGTGVGIVEVFEVDEPNTPLVNISTRGAVSSGANVLIGGFIVQGSTPRSVVVRARGPSLSLAGVPNVLANPQLVLVRSSDGATIAANDDWQSDRPGSVALAASGFAPDDAREAAVIVTLDPGAYTVIVSGVGGATGTAIVEVFRPD